MMKVFPVKDKELFLRYAVPCGEVLVKRGSLREELLRELERSVKGGKEIRIPVNGIFKVASRMCTLLARDMGKKEIDRDVIRRYFLFEHGKAVMWRSRFFPDVNPRDCLVYPARVLDSRDRLMLRTPLGERIAKNSFETELRRNDWVSIHYDQIAERIDAETAKRMLGMRK